jgi:type I restriction enzyme S subunit
MSAWPKERLGEVLKLDLDKVTVNTSEVYPMVGVLSFGRGLFNREPIENGNTSYRFFYRLKAEHVVMSQLFGWEGALALSSDNFAGKFLSPQFPTFICDSAKLERNFLGWLMRRPAFWDDLGSRASGMGDRRRTLNPEALFACEIPLPPISEQRRIIARIEEVAARIEVARTLHQKAIEEAGILWRHCAEPIFDKLVETTPIRPLGQLVSLRGGGTPSKSNPFFWNGKIPWITPKDMKARELSDAIDHISEQASKTTAAKLIPPGTILVVVRGMILSHTFPTAVLRVPAAINQDMKALIPNSEILPEFLCALFWAYNSRILNLVEKSTHDTRKLETSKLLDTKIPVPPLSEQRRIISKLAELQSEIDRLQRLQVETTSELNAFLPAILDRAFQGNL